MYKIIDFYYNYLFGYYVAVKYRIKEFPLFLKGKISFAYWLKKKRQIDIWIYTDKNISVNNETNYSYDSGISLIGKNIYQFADGSIIHNPEQKGIYLKQDNQFIKCELKDNELIPIPKEQITLDFPKTQYMTLSNKAKEKNLSLKDYLLQQISSIL